MTHEELRESIPLYAIDALPPEEEVEVRAHLETCDGCDELLTEHLRVAGDLALIAEPVAPPSSLRDRLLEQARSVRQSAPDPSVSRASARAARWRRAAAALTAVSVAIAAAAFLLARRVDQQTDDLREQERAITVITDTAAELLPMRATSENPGASGSVYIGRRGRAAAVVVAGLEDPAERIYALWIIADGNPIRVKDFTPDADGTAVLYVAENVEDLDAMAITLEPNPGNASPRGPAILRS